jgi:hypothetical protein
MTTSTKMAAELLDEIAREAQALLGAVSVRAGLVELDD